MIMIDPLHMDLILQHLDPKGRGRLAQTFKGMTRVVRVHNERYKGLFKYLPPEIMAPILQQLNFEYIVAMSRSSKEMGKLIDDSFSKGYLRSFTSFIKESLQDLIKDSKHIGDPLSLQTILSACERIKKLALEPEKWPVLKRDYPLLFQKLTFSTSIVNKKLTINSCYLTRGLRGPFINHSYDSYTPKNLPFLAHLLGMKGYEKNVDKAVRLNTELANAGDTHARNFQFNGLSAGLYGYKQNKGEAIRLNTEWAAAGDVAARLRQIIGLRHGGIDYTKDEDEAARLITELAARDPMGKCLQIHGLRMGEYGFKKDEAEAARLNTEWAAAGDREARNNQIQGLLNGIYGYKKDEAEAHRLNSKWATAGDSQARIRQFEGLAQGTSGYKKDEGEAVRRMTELAAGRDQTARAYQFRGLSEGRYGFKKDEIEALRLNMEWAVAGDINARARQIIYLFKKNTKENRAAAYRLMSLWGIIPWGEMFPSA